MDVYLPPMRAAMYALILVQSSVDLSRRTTVAVSFDAESLWASQPETSQEVKGSAWNDHLLLLAAAQGHHDWYAALALNRQGGSCTDVTWLLSKPWWLQPCQARVMLCHMLSCCTLLSRGLSPYVGVSLFVS